MITDYFVLAIKNLKHRGLRSWLTLLGIFIGILSVVSLISLSTGLKLAVTSQFGISSTEVITIQAGGLSGYGPPGSGAVDPITKDDAEAIGKLPTVEVAIGRLISTHRMEYNDVMEVSYSVSIPDGKARDISYEILDFEIFQGRMLEDGDTNSVVLGYSFYKDDNAFGKSIQVGKKVVIDGEEFKVVGILDKTGSIIFDNAAMINEDIVL